MVNQEKVNKRIERATETRKRNRQAKINSTYNNREWLFSRYCIDEMSLDEIANLCNVEYDVIWDALKKLGIPIVIMIGRDFWNDWVDVQKKGIKYAVRN